MLPLASAACCWLAYLSLSQAGQLFFSYQWDALLLEAGFLALWLAPPDALTPRSVAWQREPPRAAVWLFRWLLFRLVWSSGLVKLTSGDPTWWNLTALAHHYETQPLPRLDQLVDVAAAARRAEALDLRGARVRAAGAPRLLRAASRAGCWRRPSRWG